MALVALVLPLDIASQKSKIFRNCFRSRGKVAWVVFQVGELSVFSLKLI